MDAAMKARLVDVVKGMSSRGMSSAQIKENLMQMGLEQADIGEIIQEAQPQVTVEDIHDKAQETHNMIESGEHLEPLVEQMEGHGEHFERLHANVGELHEKHEETSAKLEQIADMKHDLEDIKATLAEIKPLVGAIKRLQESLLEVNKKVLLKEVMK